MGLFDTIVNNLKDKRRAAYTQLSDTLNELLSFMSSILKKEGLIDVSSYSCRLPELYSTAVQAEKLNKRVTLASDATITHFRELNEVFQKQVNAFESNIDRHNSLYLKTEVARTRTVLGKIEGHELDDQQMMSILRDAHNHNVVAGAGTGKTTTIIGKVKYLIGIKKFIPSEILVLSYTRAAAKEMRERLKRNTAEDIYVSTFHSYGYSILTDVEGKKPAIFSESLHDVLKEKLDVLLKDRAYKKKLLSYLGMTSHLEKTDLDADFETPEDYFSYIREHKPITLKGEITKSYGEVHVANILATNGISYIYEKAYEHDTATKQHAQYYPDFYLPDYGIYIEFFGIDRNGNVPAWFEGEDPTRTYQEGIRWKRKTHKQYGTHLIECYAYEDAEGILQENLEAKLLNSGVEFKDVSLDELLRGGAVSTDNYLNTFVSMASSIINLAKNKRLGVDDLISMTPKKSGERLIAELVAPLYEAYECFLQKSNQIDFSDMLIRAESYVIEGKYKNPFKYVIIDEYQDITASQYRLLQALRKSNDFELFCVGDDWQSIYRFNGSDVSYIMDFKDFWGDGALSRIETTYRFSQSLIDVSGSFIMKNPRQIKKSIRSGINDRNFAVSIIEGYKRESSIQFMTDRLMYLPPNSTVYLIGRYTFDIKLLDTEPRLSVKYDTATQTQKVSLRNRADLDISFFTAHRSKGLQADYVFILNNLDGTLGFPSGVEDNPLTNILLERGDRFPYAEERRLYYVALTRAKKHVYLVTIKDKESIFVKELEQQYGAQLINETYRCPLCGGKLRIIEGKNGKFFGCENYRIKNCKYTASIVLNRISPDHSYPL